MSELEITTQSIYGVLLDYQNSEAGRAEIERAYKRRRIARAEQSKTAARKYKQRYPKAAALRENAAQYKADILASQSGKCALCDKELTESTAQIDHIIPVIDPACTNERRNLRVVCGRCNLRRNRKR
jgi:5-methylcytosine-specific restriction endonuclease McrA